MKPPQTNKISQNDNHAISDLVSHLSLKIRIHSQIKQDYTNRFLHELVMTSASDPNSNSIRNA